MASTLSKVLSALVRTRAPRCPWLVRVLWLTGTERTWTAVASPGSKLSGLSKTFQELSSMIDLTLEEALDAKIAHAETQHWQLVQFGDDLRGEREQAGQSIQLGVESVPVSLRRVRLLVHPCWFSVGTEQTGRVTKWFRRGREGVKRNIFHPAASVLFHPNTQKKIACESQWKKAWKIIQIW